MKKNTALVILVAGIVVALLAGLVTFTWLQKRTRTQAKAVETQPVIVAAVDLGWGTVLNTQQVKTSAFLKGSLPGGFFSDQSGITGRTLIYPVKQGQPIFETQLAPASVKIGGVSAIIGANKRAIAIRVDKVIGVSGFVNPGNRVDVLVTLGRGDSPVTKTVLENMLVLAAGTEMQKTGNQEKPTQVDVITLEVTSEEGEKLALAATEGKIHLALRNGTDTAEVLTKGATVPALLGSLTSFAPPRQTRVASTKPVKRPMAAAPIKVVSAVEKPKEMLIIQGIRGTAVTEYKFEKGE